jgi:hypothetical protein
MQLPHQPTQAKRHYMAFGGHVLASGTLQMLHAHVTGLTQIKHMVLSVSQSIHKTHNFGDEPFFCDMSTVSRYPGDVLPKPS